MTAQTRALVRFDVCDVDLNVVAQITPADPGALTCKDGVRTVRGVSLFPADTSAFDPYQHRLVPVWVQTENFVTTETQLGVFVAASGTKPWVKYKDPDTGTDAVGYFADWDLQDLSAILDVPLIRSYGLAQGDPVTPLMETMLEDLGFVTYDLAWFPVGAAEPAVFEQGRDSTWGAFEQMMETVGGRFFFDRFGVPTSTIIPAPGDIVASRTYDTTGAILDPPVYTVDPFAPNRWEAVGGTDNGPIVGTYDLPSDASNSYANRGFLVVERFDVQALDQTTANVAAQAQAVDDVASSETVSFSTQVAPDTEPFEALSVDGDLWLESEFGFDLSGDTVMEHSASRIWVPS